MLGFRLAGDAVGTTNETAIDVLYDIHIERSGYNLPTYHFGGGAPGWWPFPGFEFYIAIGALASLSILTIVIKKKRK